MAYQDELKKYTDLVNGLPRFKEMVKRKLAEQNNYNKDLISEQNRLLERQLSLPSELRAEYANSAIRNPLAYENIVQQRASNVGSELGTVNDLLAARQQEQDALVNAALEAYRARMNEQAVRASSSGGGGGYSYVPSPTPREEPNVGLIGAVAGGANNAVDIEIVDEPKKTVTDVASNLAGFDTGGRLSDRAYNAIDALRRKKPKNAWEEIKRGAVELARPGSSYGKLAGFGFSFLSDPRNKRYTRTAVNTIKDKIMNIFRR